MHTMFMDTHFGRKRLGSKSWLTIQRQSIFITIEYRKRALVGAVTMFTLCKTNFLFLFFLPHSTHGFWRRLIFRVLFVAFMFLLHLMFLCVCFHSFSFFRNKNKIYVFCVFENLKIVTFHRINCKDTHYRFCYRYNFYISGEFQHETWITITDLQRAKNPTKSNGIDKAIALHYCLYHVLLGMNVSVCVCVPFFIITYTFPPRVTSCNFCDGFR